MGFKMTRTDFKGGKNILASEHFKYIEAGATLDSASFGVGVIELGTLLARDASTGKFVEFVGADVANYDDFGILDVDVIVVDATEDEIVGSVLVYGAVYVDKLPENADLEAFKEATFRTIRFVNHIA